MEIDFGEIMKFSQGGKAMPDLLKNIEGRVRAILKKLQAGGEFTGWVRLPFDEEIASRLKSFVFRIPKKIDHCVVMGIGGSSLGPLALCSASGIMENFRKKDKSSYRKIFFLDNSDSDTVGGIFDSIDFERTIFVVITKSGSTVETMAQFFIAWEMAKEKLGEKAKEHFVFITDPQKGELRKLSDRLGVISFPIPEDVGGRFSVLSPVGLLPCAIAGIDPVQLLIPARNVMKLCILPELLKNPAAMLGATAFLLDTEFGRNIHVLMVYSDKLKETGAWFCQLWAESLGKRKEGKGVGPTPLFARGATDQHSILQLLREGPPDKFVMFVGIKNRRHLVIPQSIPNLEKFDYLFNRGMDELISFEMKATRKSLSLGGVPAISIMLDEASPESVVSFMVMMEVAVSVAGFLYGINPFDQPGVEESKRFVKALMGDKNYEKEKIEIENSNQDNEQWLYKV